MRLFVASGIFHPEPGGPATYLFRLLPDFQARGHEVRLLTFGDAPTDGYPYPVRRIPRRFLPLRVADYARAARPLAQWSDLIFVNSLGLPLIGLPRRPRVLKVVGDLAWERAINRGWIPPTEDIDTFQSRGYDRRVMLLKRQRSREVQRADAVIVPSEYLRQMVIGWGAPAERVTVIYNALAPDAAASARSPDEARAELGLPPGPLLLTVARLTAWKGVDALLRALARVPDARLLIAGDGPEEARLRALATQLGLTERVQFLGRVDRSALAVYFRAVDYTVLYSGYEGLPHVLLESLQSGTPVIASDKGGNPEVVYHDENGLLVPYPDEDALVTALDTAFSGETRARLAAGTGAGLERFRWTALVEQTASLLKRTGAA
ncbi:MAG: glycosyltransferase family 4 protein [Chloroflexota bacterium]